MKPERQEQKKLPTVLTQWCEHCLRLVIAEHSSTSTHVAQTDTFTKHWHPQAWPRGGHVRPIIVKCFVHCSNINKCCLKSQQTKYLCIIFETRRQLLRVLPSVSPGQRCGPPNLTTPRKNLAGAHVTNVDRLN